MKINAKHFSKINTEPFLTQETNSGIIELYKLSDFPEIYNNTVGKGRFYFWSTINTDVYKLLVEESYYNDLKDLYSKRVNEVQIEFFKEVGRLKRNTFIKLLLPLTIVMFIIYVLLTIIFAESEHNTIIYCIPILAFFFASSVINKKMNQKVTTANIESIDKLKNILGAQKFEDLLDKQDAYIEEFYKQQRAALGIEEPEDFSEPDIDAVENTAPEFNYDEENVVEETTTNNIENTTDLDVVEDPNDKKEETNSIIETNEESIVVEAEESLVEEEKVDSIVDTSEKEGE